MAARLLPVDMSVTRTHDHMDHTAHSSTEGTRMDRKEKIKKEKNIILMHQSCIPVNFMQCKKSKLYI